MGDPARSSVNDGDLGLARDLSLIGMLAGGPPGPAKSLSAEGPGKEFPHWRQLLANAEDEEVQKHKRTCPRKHVHNTRARTLHTKHVRANHWHGANHAHQLARMARQTSPRCIRITCPWPTFRKLPF